MTTLAANKPRSFEKGARNTFPVVAATVIFEGSAVGVVTASGHARPLQSGDRFAGFAEGKADNSKGAAGATDVDVVGGGKVQLPVTAAAVTDVGAPVYATDDNAFVLSSGVFIGFVERFVSSGVVVVTFDAFKLSDAIDAADIATALGYTPANAANLVGLFDLKSDIDASGNPNYPAASKADAYPISVAGKVGGASGVSVDAGDLVVAKADNAGGTQASVGTSWFVIEHNRVGSGGSGDVVGPSSAVNNGLALFDSTTGKLLKDGGPLSAALADAGVPQSVQKVLTQADILPLANDGTSFDLVDAQGVDVLIAPFLLVVKWTPDSRGGAWDSGSSFSISLVDGTPLLLVANNANPVTSIDLGPLVSSPTPVYLQASVTKGIANFADAKNKPLKFWLDSDVTVTSGIPAAISIGGVNGPDFILGDVLVDEDQLGNDPLTSTVAGVDGSGNVTALTPTNFGATPYGVGADVTYLVSSIAYPIIAVDAAAGKFTVAGDHTARLTAGKAFTVTGSTGNDYPGRGIDSSVFSGGNTVITVTGDSIPLPDATVDGDVRPGGYVDVNVDALSNDASLTITTLYIPT